MNVHTNLEITRIVPKGEFQFVPSTHTYIHIYIWSTHKIQYYKLFKGCSCVAL